MAASKCMKVADPSVVLPLSGYVDEVDALVVELHFDWACEKVALADDCSVGELQSLRLYLLGVQGQRVTVVLGLPARW